MLKFVSTRLKTINYKTIQLLVKFLPPVMYLYSVLFTFVILIPIIMMKAISNYFTLFSSLMTSTCRRIWVKIKRLFRVTFVTYIILFQ